MMQQRLDIHFNLINEEIVDESKLYRFSSAINYIVSNGLIIVILIN